MKSMTLTVTKAAGEDRTSPDGRKVFRAVATTPALDRVGEVVLPKGAQIKNFMANPVLLEIHNYQRTTVGQILSLDITDDAMTFDFVFGVCARSKELQEKYEMGDMSAFSIGFKPKSYVDLWMPWDDPPTDMTEVTVTLPNGEKQTIDLTKYEQIPYTIYTKWELLEISPVPVPANPEALLLREAEEIVRRAAASSPVTKSFVQAELAASLGPVMKMLAKFNGKFCLDDLCIPSVTPAHTVRVLDRDWNAADAREILARWASDGTGEVEKMNWVKFREGCAFVDTEAADNFASYKFLHHNIDSDGSLVAVWRGVAAAMAAFLGEKSLVGDIENQKAVHDHLSGHYRDAGKEAPAFDHEYTEEELKAIESEPLVTTKTEGEGAQPAPSSAGGEQVETELLTADPMKVEGIDDLKTMLVEIDKKMTRLSTDFEESIVRLSLKVRMVQDLLEKRVAKPVEKKIDQPQEEVAFEVSKGLLDHLEQFVAKPVVVE